MNPTVGQTAARTITLTEDMVLRFAALTGDYNPLHFEDAFVQNTRFKRRIAQGGLTTGMINTLIAMDLPGPGSVFMSQNYRFPNPAFIGDTLTAQVEVVAVKPGKPAAQLSIRISRQDGAVVLEGDAWVYTARPSSAEADETRSEASP